MGEMLSELSTIMFSSRDLFRPLSKPPSFAGFTLTSLFAFMLSSCTLAPSPVELHQEGDALLTCPQISDELIKINNEIRNLIPNIHKVTFKENTENFIGYPYVFLDLPRDKAILQDAYRARFQHLKRLAISKKCRS